ncbi:hypothetical protein KC460_04350 [Candidatus Dependentiae bacterium]|nr:hypothetical protein [Candidatus Dependentiae bacterium]
MWALLGISFIFNGFMHTKWVEITGAGNQNIVDSYKFYVKIGNIQNIWGTKDNGTPYK